MKNSLIVSLAVIFVFCWSSQTALSATYKYDNLHRLTRVVYDNGTVIKILKILDCGDCEYIYIRLGKFNDSFPTAVMRYSSVEISKNGVVTYPSSLEKELM